MTTYGDYGDGDIYGSQGVFPEEILIKCLNQIESVQRYALEALRYRPYLPSSAIEICMALSPYLRKLSSRIKNAFSGLQQPLC
ncbi:hypothetical protein BGX26_000489 [Mortierella sp. AD094]|nr:hypothetical protein BGX26_000489 [Mortierella sp. AD094]